MLLDNHLISGTITTSCNIRESDLEEKCVLIVALRGPSFRGSRNGNRHSGRRAHPETRGKDHDPPTIYNNLVIGWWLEDWIVSAMNPGGLQDKMRLVDMKEA